MVFAKSGNVHLGMLLPGGGDFLKNKAKMRTEEGKRAGTTGGAVSQETSKELLRL